ncbi:HpcH/HpaI aldolase/citrate lyase family protein [Pelagibacterium halotolerans]|uniref:HpcH/HpaI aldolase family protein n=1 Tax=Pelagibacterium halotolerans TaxID=531813 RepID=UPI00384C9C77
MSTPNLDFLEIAANAGFKRVVCDVEHNAFSPDRREALVVAARAIGLSVFFKVEGPEPVWVQRALDLDVDGVIVPHCGRLEECHAALETAKFPPRGTRSYAAGRSARFTAPDAGYFARCDRDVLCLPMIETAHAFDDIDAILAHDCVDGVFVGPFDLALTRGRETYAFTDADRADISHIARSAKSAGKPWWIPAWKPQEQRFAIDEGASVRVIAAEHQVLMAGLASVIDQLPQRSAR